MDLGLRDSVMDRRETNKTVVKKKTIRVSSKVQVNTITSI